MHPLSLYCSWYYAWNLNFCSFLQSVTFIISTRSCSKDATMLQISRGFHSCKRKGKGFCRIVYWFISKYERDHIDRSCGMFFFLVKMDLHMVLTYFGILFSSIIHIVPNSLFINITFLAVLSKSFSQWGVLPSYSLFAEWNFWWSSWAAIGP